MMKLMKITPFLLLIFFLFIGCTKQQSPSISASDASLEAMANYNVKLLYPNGLPESETISVDIAKNNVINKLKVDENDYINYSIENIELINDRIYYIFRRLENRPEHIVTLGYYAVDVFTGEVFDTKGLTDLIKLD